MRLGGAALERRSPRRGAGLLCYCRCRLFPAHGGDGASPSCADDRPARDHRRESQGVAQGPEDAAGRARRRCRIDRSFSSDTKNGRYGILIDKVGSLAEALVRRTLGIAAPRHREEIQRRRRPGEPKRRPGDQRPARQGDQSISYGATVHFKSHRKMSLDHAKDIDARHSDFRAR